MGMKQNRNSDFSDLRQRLADGDPPPGMPKHISDKLKVSGLDLQQQRLYFSQNCKGEVEWFEREEGFTVIRMTPFRADLVEGKFSHVFDRAFGKNCWKIDHKRPMAA